MRDIFLEQIEDAKGYGRPHGRSCRGSHDYTALWKPAEGPLTLDAWMRQRVSDVIGEGDALHLLIKECSARERYNLEPLAL
jgi:hypothetical protein